MGGQVNPIFLKGSECFRVNAVADPKVSSVIVDIKHEFEADPRFVGFTDDDSRRGSTPHLWDFLGGRNQD